MQKQQLVMLVLVATLGVVMLAAALTELRQPTPAITVAEQAALTVMSPSDVTLKSVSGKYKYRDEDAEDAEQGWAVAGECPTSMTSLNPWNPVTLSGNTFGRMRADSQSHTFTPVYQQYKLNKQGTSMTVKFPDWYAARRMGITSPHHQAIPNFGSFKMRLKTNKDGQQMLQFMYQIKKASQGGLMTDTNDYSEMREYVQSNGTVKTTTTVQGGLQVGSESHSASQNIDVKMTRNAASYKLCKPCK
jgi:hypothetical protein